MLAGQLVEFFPQLAVQDWFSRRIAPAHREPLRQKLRNPTLDLLRVGEHSDSARSRQHSQSGDHGREFHPIIGEPGIAAQHAFPSSALENAGPAARTRISGSGAI